MSFVVPAPREARLLPLSKPRNLLARWGLRPALALLVAGAACGGTPPEPRAVLERARDRLGGTGLAERVGGLRIEAHGMQDRAAERQGSRFDGEDPGEYRETLAWLPSSDGLAVSFEYRHDRSDGTSEWVREVHDRPREKLVVVLADGFAVRLVSDDHEGERRRLVRRLLPELLDELLAGEESLRLRPGTARELLIEGVLTDGTELELVLAEGLPRSITYRAELPTFGRVPVTWRFDDYREVDGIGEVPHRYRVEVDGREWIRQTVQSIETGPATGRPFGLPDGYAEPQRVELPVDGDPASAARVEPLGEGIWRVRNLRTGFHPMFVETEEGVVAVDAPAGYPLLAQLPAGDVAPGPTADWLSRRFVELIRETVPDKPITHLVITHFHGDHAGGLPAFVDEGVTVLASAAAARGIRAWLGDRREGSPEIAVVSGSEPVAGGEVVVRTVGDNPHTEEMLVVWLPRRSLLFVSDLFTPVEVDAYPLPSHAALDRAFVEWVTGSGLRPAEIYSMHSARPGTREHLERVRD